MTEAPGMFNAHRPPPIRIVNGRAQIRRNDPCPCGSGSKFKHCHYAHATNPDPTPEPKPAFRPQDWTPKQAKAWDRNIAALAQKELDSRPDPIMQDEIDKHPLLARALRLIGYTAPDAPPPTVPEDRDDD